MNKSDIKIIKSKRKTFSLEMKNDLSLVARVPIGASSKAINDFITRSDSWIKKTEEKIKENKSEFGDVAKLSDRELRDLYKVAKEELPLRVAYFAKLMKVSYYKITIRAQRTRWGSCTTKGNLNFNCLLMLTPKWVQDYVVVHELCHRLHMNHSKEFWAEVEGVMPNYKEAKKWLADNGASLIERLP